MTRSALIRKHGVPCARIVETTERTFIFSYEAEWLAGQSEWLSLTLPFERHRSPVALAHMPAFLEGLIPEGWLLSVANKIRPGLASDRFGLLLATARDCIGSASVEELDADDDNALRPLPSPEGGTRRALENPHGRCLACMRPLATRADFYHAECSARVFGTRAPFDVPFSQEQIEDLAKQNIAARLVVPGAQRKISGSLLPAEGKGRGRLTLVGAGSGLFILKPEHPDEPTFPANEHLAMSLMEAAGVPTALRALVVSVDGKLAYVTRRFDREKGPGGTTRRLSMEDFGQLFQRVRRSDDKYQGSYEKVGRFLRQSSSRALADVATFFDQVFASYLIGNNDFHLRNVSVFTEENKARLTPAYDVVSTQLIDPEPALDVTLAVNGKKSKLRRRDWLAFGAAMGLSEQACARRMKRFATLWPSFEEEIACSLLPDGHKAALAKLMTGRLQKAIESSPLVSVSWTDGSPEAFPEAAAMGPASSESAAPAAADSRSVDSQPAGGEKSKARAPDGASGRGAICAFPGCDLPRAPGKKLYCAEHSRGALARKRS